MLFAVIQKSMESISGFATNLNVEFSQYPISSFCSSFYVWGRNISEIVCKPSQPRNDFRYISAPYIKGTTQRQTVSRQRRPLMNRGWSVVNLMCQAGAMLVAVMGSVEAKVVVGCGTMKTIAVESKMWRGQCGRQRQWCCIVSCNINQLHPNNKNQHH